MGTSRRTILSILSIILPATTFVAVSAEASTHTHAHHTKTASVAKAAHHGTHKTAAAHPHGKTPAAG